MSAALNYLNDLEKKSLTLPNVSNYRIGIVISKYYPEITESLLKGCIETLKHCGVEETNIYVEYAPGTFELPLSAAWVYKHYTPDAVISLGCVIKGETRHFDFICNSVSEAIMRLGLVHNVPFIFGVLTPDTLQQAADRAGGKHGNKGEEAALAALSMVALRKKLN